MMKIKSKLDILIAGDFGGKHLLASSFEQAFSQLGHHVRVLDTTKSRQYLSPWLTHRIPHRLTIRSFYLRQLGARAWNEYFLKTAVETKPDFLLILNGYFLSPETLRSIKAHGITIFVFHADNPFPPFPNNRPEMIPFTLESDCCFIWSHSLVERLTRAGLKTVKYLPFGWDETVFPSLENFKEKDDAYDVVFVGNWSPEREKWLTPLARQHKIFIWGSDYWGNRTKFGSPLRTCWQGRELGGEEAAVVLRKSKICLNILNQQNMPDGCNMRAFELPGCGAFALSTRTTALLEIFPAGEAGAYFGTKDELLAQAAFYLSHPQAREEIKKRSHAIVASGHRYFHRAEEIVRTYEEMALPANTTTAAVRDVNIDITDRHAGYGQQLPARKNQDITAILVVHNEEKLVRRCLNSIKPCAAEIIVIHDGPCRDNSLKIAAEFSDQVLEGTKYGCMEAHLVDGLYMAKHDWILRLDADEYLSDELIAHMSRLDLRETSVTHFLARWREWKDGVISKQNYTKKVVLFNKRHCVSIGLPHRTVSVSGDNMTLDGYLEHTPPHVMYGFRDLVVKKLRPLALTDARLRYMTPIKVYPAHSENLLPKKDIWRNEHPLATMPLFVLNTYFKSLLNLTKARTLFTFKRTFMFAHANFVNQVTLSYYMFREKQKARQRRSDPLTVIGQASRDARPQSLRICFIGTFSDGSTSKMRLDTLRALGHQMFPINTLPFLPSKKLQSVGYKICAKLGFPVVFPLNSMIGRIFKEHEDEWDVVWIESIDTIDHTILALMRRHCPRATFVSFVMDDPFSPVVVYPKRFFKTIPYYDIHVVPREMNIPEFKKRGARRVIRYHKGFYPSVHRPVAPRRQEASFDVFFAGHYEPVREESIAFLLQNGINVTVAGNRDWKRGKFWPLIKRNFIDGAIYGEAYVQAICGAKINLCFFSKWNRDEERSRLYEIPACGAFMLAERNNFNVTVFSEGKEAAFFSSNEELLEKVRFYLSQPKERLEIAAKARERSLQSGYSYHARLSELLSVIETEISAE